MKNTFILLSLLFLLCVGLSNLLADNTKEDSKVDDDKIAAVRKISFEDLKKAIVEKKVIVFDYNGDVSFAKGHIPSAINAKGQELEKHLPADKSALIVSYCANERCQAWKEGAKKVLSLGYTNVKNYSPGIQGWVKSGGEIEK